MTGQPPFDRSDNDPGIPTLTVLTDETGHGRSAPAAQPRSGGQPSGAPAVGTRDSDALPARPSAPHAEPALRAALQAAVEDAVDEALDEAVALLRARLAARLPEIVAQVLRQTRSG